MAGIALPRIVRIGANALAELPDCLNQAGLSRPFLVTDRYLLEHGLVARVERMLEQAGLPCRTFADAVPEPTLAAVHAALDAFAGGEHDCVVGLGGGSAIDTAKVVAVLAAQRRAIAEMKAPATTDTPGLPIIAVPTTAGTGTEATRFTILTDETSSEKMLCAGMAFLPTIAIVDYELTLSKPPRLTADTGIDALTHAIEAYVSRRANAFSDAMALSAMRLIMRSLRRVCTDPADRSAREGMMVGAHHAGLAFSNASVALVHGMSRPLGAIFHVPHGLSNAMLLPAVTVFSAPAARGRYADCARAMGVAPDGEADERAVALLVEALHQINLDLHVPTPAAFGIPAAMYRSAIPVMVEQALASGSPANNPRAASPDEIARLYHDAYA